MRRRNSRMLGQVERFENQFFSSAREARRINRVRCKESQHSDFHFSSTLSFFPDGPGVRLLPQAHFQPKNSAA